MNRRLQDWLLSIYPRRWRDRYGQEVGSLADELIDSGETTPLRAGFDLTFSAVTERGRALGERWRALGRRRVLAMATAFAMLLVLAFALTGHQAMSGSAAATISCRANIVSVSQPKPGTTVQGRLIKVQAWTRVHGGPKYVMAIVAARACGPFGCLAMGPSPARLRAVMKARLGAVRQNWQVLPPPGKRSAINAPALAGPCGQMHAQVSRVRLYKPGAPPQAVKKQVPVKKKK
jgi:hypothetical protein